MRCARYPRGMQHVHTACRKAAPAIARRCSLHLLGRVADSASEASVASCLSLRIASTTPVGSRFTQFGNSKSGRLRAKKARESELCPAVEEERFRRARPWW
jgi:hypothetical protein